MSWVGAILGKSSGKRDRGSIRVTKGDKVATGESQKRPEKINRA
jgi:hypothetical protein